MEKRGRATYFLFAAVALELLFLLVTALDSLDRPIAKLFDGLFGAALWAFVPYVAAVYIARKHKAPSAKQVLLWALLLRLPFYFIWPVLSDDLFRYVWDGKVQLAGLNPYICEPKHEALAHLRETDIWPYINHPEIPTPYPYFAQLLFFLGALLSPSHVWGVKLILGLCDFGAILALMAVLKSRKQEPGLALAYAWNPLLALEFAWSGHIDAAAIGLFVISLHWLTTPDLSKRSRALGGLFFGLSILTKYVSILALPALWWRGGKEARRGLLFAPLALIVALPYLYTGKSTSGSLGVYTRRWVFNDSIHALTYAGVRAGLDQIIDSEVLLPLRVVRRMLDPQKVDEAEQNPAYATTADRTRFARFQMSSYVSRGIVGFLLLVVIAWGVRRRLDPWESSFIAFGGFLALFPTVHPWYAAWGIPFLALFEGLPMLAFSATVLLSYHVLGTNWKEDTFFTWLEYTPIAALIVWGAIQRWRSRRRSLGKALPEEAVPDPVVRDGHGAGA